jgi:hypothetical protein
LAGTCASPITTRTYPQLLSAQRPCCRSHLLAQGARPRSMRRHPAVRPLLLRIGPTYLATPRPCPHIVLVPNANQRRPPIVDPRLGAYDLCVAALVTYCVLLLLATRQELCLIVRKVTSSTPTVPRRRCSPTDTLLGRSTPRRPPLRRRRVRLHRCRWTALRRRTTLHVPCRRCSPVESLPGRSTLRHLPPRCSPVESLPGRSTLRHLPPRRRRVRLHLSVLTTLRRRTRASSLRCFGQSLAPLRHPTLV